jgi:hypothetical protein
MMMACDLNGQKFGRLEILRPATKDRHGKARWWCLCDCGRQKIVGARALTAGLTRSCGCLRRETTSRTRRAHGLTRTPTYTSYQSAKDRCNNPRSENYRYYGGRGIRFLYQSFEQFFRDLGERPPGLTLERIDNDGHYEPGNCRWATLIDQANNKSNNQILTAFGRTLTLALWAREFNINAGTLRHRVEKGWIAENALLLRPRAV